MSATHWDQGDTPPPSWTHWLLVFSGREAACMLRWERLALGLCLGLPASLAACQASEDSGGHTLQAQPLPVLAVPAGPAQTRGQPGKRAVVTGLQRLRPCGNHTENRRGNAGRRPATPHPPQGSLPPGHSGLCGRNRCPCILTASGIPLLQGRLRE